MRLQRRHRRTEHAGEEALAGLFGVDDPSLRREEIIANLHYQVAALEGMAQSLGLALAHVKPHGALYHDMMARDEVRAAILQAVSAQLIDQTDAATFSFMA